MGAHQLRTSYGALNFRDLGGHHRVTQVGGVVSSVERCTAKLFTLRGRYELEGKACFVLIRRGGAAVEGEGSYSS